MCLLNEKGHEIWENNKRGFLFIRLSRVAFHSTFLSSVTRPCHAWDLLGRDDGYLMADIGQTLDFSSKIRLSAFLL